MKIGQFFKIFIYVIIVISIICCGFITWSIWQISTCTSQISAERLSQKVESIDSELVPINWNDLDDDAKTNEVKRAGKIYADKVLQATDGACTNTLSVIAYETNSKVEVIKESETIYIYKFNYNAFGMKYISNIDKEADSGVVESFGPFVTVKYKDKYIKLIQSEGRWKISGVGNTY